jgi:Flp pilus assembly pilin Flp
MKLTKTRRFLKDTRGANLVEYIILVGVIAILALGAFKVFGGKVKSKVTAQGTTVDTVDSTTSP